MAIGGSKASSRRHHDRTDKKDRSLDSKKATFDEDLYDKKDKFAGYNTSIPTADDEDDGDDDMGNGDSTNRLAGQYTATTEQLNEFSHGGAIEDFDRVESKEKQAQIANRQSDYQNRMFDRKLSPDAGDFKETMALRELEREEARVNKIIAEKKTNGDTANGDTEVAEVPRKRKKRWDTGTADETATEPVTEEVEPDEAPKQKRSRWDTDATPAPATESSQKKRSRFDQAPSLNTSTPDPQQGVATPLQQAPIVSGFGTDISARNAPLSDADIDALLPAEGYKVLEPPPGYEVRPTARGIPSAGGPATLFSHQSVDASSLPKQLPNEIPGVGELQYMKESDATHFAPLLQEGDDSELTLAQLKEKKILRLLLKVKNGSPSGRKTALRQITDNARVFGAGPLLDNILPLLLERTLEDHERHLIVKVIDRILYKLGELVRPYVNRLLAVISPLLIDQDFYARVEGREIISNLAKSAGLSSMISTLRPSIDHVDEYVRNTTARSLAVVASALGIPALVPFLKAVCKSKRSHLARHTGVKAIQQIAILMGVAVLPHLKSLVDCIADNLNDEQTKVRTVTSLAIAALAEASHPYGIDSFDPILNELWTGARRQRGKGLAGYLKAVGFLIPLMDEEYSSYYTGEIMTILRREFSSPDEEMKRVVLRCISQCAQTEGVTASFLKENVLTEFMKAFWNRRMALDKRSSRDVVTATVDLGQRVGVQTILGGMVHHLKDENEPLRKMSMETIEKLVAALGAADIDQRLEEQLIDGVLHAFQEQSVEDVVMLNGIGTVVSALDIRCKSYLPQIVSTVLWRLNNRSATVRQQAADLISRVAPVMKNCAEEQLMSKLGVVLYEYLGEEYPEVLGSILGALRAIVSVIGLSNMQPPIKDLLPRLTPILRNRHEKVQENTIDLVGRIADRGPESVTAREWMRICFELLDMLKAHKKGIRRAANNTFGFIAKAIGPQDVLQTLLNNLRVQERQSRVCTAVAIGIVAETCAPFTVLPALMSEYRVPELNVQNGVLKSLSFLCEYIGEMAKDYVYAITPLLEDALIDRDQVHRQTAASVTAHLAIGCVGLGVEDALIHLLNLVWPNIYEVSPHVIDRVIGAVDAIRTAVGPGTIMNYYTPMLFHPARKVREPGWRCFNNSYVQQADSMVPYYPDIEEIGFNRQELMALI